MAALSASKVSSEKGLFSPSDFLAPKTSTVSKPIDCLAHRAAQNMVAGRLKSLTLFNMARRNRGRVALVRSHEESNWLSCKSIVQNLLAVYSDLFPDMEVREFSMTETPEGAWALSEKIHQYAPQRLIFVDHAPHPHLLIHALDIRYRRRPLPPTYFHVFGDFTLYPKQWLSIEPILKKTSVRFICASPRQKNLVKSFCKQTREAVFLTSPFPVNADLFYFDPKIREEWRRQLGCDENDVVISYTGRMSLQKNIVELTEEVFQFWKLTGAEIKLFFAGPFDFLGAPFFGIELTHGSYYQYWTKQMNRFPKAFQDRIKYCGHLSGSRLRGLYNATDVYASLSFHHDEDYGMAPAEALCCGTTAVLSSWGGYASFTDKQGSCQLVHTKIGKNGPEYSPRSFQQALSRQIKRSQIDRDRRARSNVDRLSIEAARKILADVYHEETRFPFQGFSRIMNQLALEHTDNTQFIGGRGKGSVYAKIYENYTEN